MGMSDSYAASESQRTEPVTSMLHSDSSHEVEVPKGDVETAAEVVCEQTQPEPESAESSPSVRGAAEAADLQLALFRDSLRQVSESSGAVNHMKLPELAAIQKQLLRVLSRVTDQLTVYEDE
eukprot:m.910739 g.910739  ORF g.910739 m.910739 type:complete len:122 (-) comp60112_c0_seq25:227-592(-)